MQTKEELRRKIRSQLKKLEDADASLLKIDEYDLDKHVSMQAAAIAYYGMLKKDAARIMASAKRDFDRWKQVKWMELKRRLAAEAGKSTNADVDNSFSTAYVNDLVEWDKRIDELEEQYDTLDSWYESWRSKSHEMHDMVQMAVEEMITPPTKRVPVRPGHNGRIAIPRRDVDAD